MQELAKLIGEKAEGAKGKGKQPSEEQVDSIPIHLKQLEAARAGADSLTSYIMGVLEAARTEGVTDSEIAEVIRQTIIDLKDVRQNLMRFREIKLTESE
jgi:phage portal protein BeeE